MCLLSIGLETLGLLVRVWLWISVPMAVIILLVATWMNYLRNARPRGGLKLALGGLGGEISPGNGDIEGGEMAADEVEETGHKIPELGK
jgi:hypothetical protein